ncbi:MAG TPA: phosphoribosylglycinamide formyltransferase [Candidatus Omnitrophica bacterium]|nr:MAG: phosphoribosylglycinamide formyltransferase [Candidatus Omnitrophota bacterium]RKY35355.1 MAG: phosphoribosylglycinamide formyltransferase [Candidatus Omnitrophota bacterium]RKY44281.1 MAG: phosphoribosylglycinamide formyltransferase [Candidatus Omnitrophota bacterium]HEC68721.1 phosphoribosylglycinamide formyltransferase [Candidatus Omnitrophota bacterium]
MNIAVLASGRGTNFEAIAKAVKRGFIRAKLKLLITDKENAGVRERAKKFAVKDIFIDPRNFKSRQDFDREVVRILKKEKINLVVLAGFMRIITPYFVKAFKNRILNIHPAILPSFKGVGAIERAYNYGVKVTGITVHFVDEGVDTGPIILQEALKIREKESLQSLEERIHKLEHRLYPLAVKLFSEKRLKIKGRKVEIKA